MKLENQIAVITGGASGLGKACAEALGARDVKVVVWDRQVITDPHLKLAASFECDVSSASDVEQTLQKTVEAIGIPRLCINCAGIAPAKRMVDRDNYPQPLEEFKRVIDINLIGTFNVMRTLAAVMTKLPLDPGSQERGVIINTASVAAYEGQIGQLAYSASKGGVVSMTLPAARELATHAIRVNTIAPGIMATPMLLGMPQPVQEALAATVTFPKRLGRPEEFAALVMHIIENELLNGEVIRLDGALRMQAK